MFDLTQFSHVTLRSGLRSLYEYSELESCGRRNGVSAEQTEGDGWKNN